MNREATPNHVTEPDDSNSALPKSVPDRHKRRLILAMGTLIGGVAAAELLGNNGLAVASSYSPNIGQNVEPGKIFSVKLMADLKAICQLVIPRTETLGAGDVDVHGFIDNQLFHCYEKAQQMKVENVLTELNKQNEAGFVSLSKEQQMALLNRFDSQHKGIKNDLIDGFKLLKSLIVFGYYTSEEGASKELKYLAFPGPFKGSIPYESVGQGYGAFAYY